MGSMEKPGSRGSELARRFLQTAVVVDDEAYTMASWSSGPEGKVVEPDRSTSASSQEDRRSGGRSKHTLDAQSVVESFSTLGVICGVVSPALSPMEVMRRADIVVLDWKLREDDPRYVLKLLCDLLTGEIDRNSLRLVAIYTGEPGLEDICAEVTAELERHNLEPEMNENKMTISYRHGRIVLYAKSNVNLVKPLKGRSVAETDLPERLVDDFSAMTEGLLPGIALTSLTAVREGAHRVLDRFCAELDPAFLAHRACISNPDDAERQIVNHVSEELRGLMDNAVAEQSPAGADAVKRWIRRKSGGAAPFVFGSQELKLEQTIELATRGLEASKKGLGASKLPNRAFEYLSAGFAGGEIRDLDERLAWIMSFRTVFDAPPPTLWLGSIVTATVDDDEKHLICMKPRCDCVRLEKETSFFFLPLVEPKNEKEQLVVRLGEEFKRLGINFDPACGIHRQFRPSADSGAVTAATRRGPGGDFEFTDACCERYTWKGELKAEYAQRIAQAFAATLSRVAVDESEWLRRKAREGR